jgi:hypothetical protein
MAIPTSPNQASSDAPTVRLGLRENLPQFSLLVLVNALVGATVGQERTVLPLLAEEVFELEAYSAMLSFIAVFGVSKAITTLFAGALGDRYGRKPVLVTGWLIAVPVPLLLMWAPTWGWVLFANVLLGINQGLTWSLTVIMKFDLAGSELHTPDRSELRVLECGCGERRTSGTSATGAPCCAPFRLQRRRSSRHRREGLRLPLPGVLLRTPPLRELALLVIEVSGEEAAEGDDHRGDRGGRGRLGHCAGEGESEVVGLDGRRRVAVHAGHDAVRERRVVRQLCRVGTADAVVGLEVLQVEHADGGGGGRLGAGGGGHVKPPSVAPGPVQSATLAVMRLPCSGATVCPRVCAQLGSGSPDSALCREL